MAAGFCHICNDSTDGRVSSRIYYCLKCSRPAASARGAAVNKVAYAVRTGRLVSLSNNHVACVDCGKRATDYDHRSYARPLDVVPVCRRCNDARGPACYVGTAAGIRAPDSAA